jgi:hypothetical protein
MPTLTERLTTAVVTTETEATKLFAIVEGPATGEGSTVTTLGGPVKTAAAKILEIEERADNIYTARDEAVAAAETAADDAVAAVQAQLEDEVLAAQDAAIASAGFADDSEGFKNQAEAARDQALINASLSNQALTGYARVAATANSAIAGLLTIDGLTLVAGDVVLLTAQTTTHQNGPWVAAAGSWTRPTWYAAANATQAFFGGGIVVNGGGVSTGDSIWRLTTTGAITIGTTGTAWVRGVESAVTQAVTANDTRTATTAFVQTAIDANRSGVGGVFFDGTAASGVECALGSPGALATDPFSVHLRLTPTTSTAALAQFLFTLTSDTVLAFAATTFAARIDNGSLIVVIYGASSADSRIATVAGFAATYGGKKRDLSICRTSAGTLLLFIDGVSLAFVETTSGTPPANWLANVTSTYFRVGKWNSTVSAIGILNSITVYNYDISSVTGRILAIIANGARPVYSDLVIPQPASQVALNTGNNTTGYGGGAGIITLSGNSATGFTAVQSGGSIAFGFVRAVASANLANSVVGQRYRIKTTLTLNGGHSGGFPNINIDSNGTGITVEGYSNLAVGPNTFEKTMNGSNSIIYPIAWGVGTGMDFTTSDNSITALGAVVHLDGDVPAIGFQWPDTSKNRIDGKLTATGVLWIKGIEPERKGTIRTTTATNGNQQLLGQAVFDAANRYRITSWIVTAASGSVTLSLGNVSAGAQYVSGATIGTTPTDITLLVRIAATANLWANANASTVLTHVISYERID